MADDASGDVYANRDEPVPSLVVPGLEAPANKHEHAHVLTESSDGEGKRAHLKGKLMERLPGVKPNHDHGSHTDAERRPSLQDRLFAKILQQVIPTEEPPGFDGSQDERSTRYVNRPGFSLPLMTNNFRRFNARIGVVFIFQTRLTRLLTWRYPPQTLSLTLVYTLTCLNPYLLPILPLLATLFFLLIPAYLSRHPPPSSQPGKLTYSLAGPPLAPPRTIRPAAEISKDFFRNMRDLQNSMDDFATLHDAAVRLIAPATNFADEPLSTAVFQLLFLASGVLFVAAPVLPWRVIALALGWAAVGAGHPRVQEVFARSVYEQHVHPASQDAQSRLQQWIDGDIVLDAHPEVREVEIFELQRRTGLDASVFSAASSSSSSPSSGSTMARRVVPDADYEAWVFGASAWEPRSPRRVAGERCKGTRFFEDVRPPAGWEWAGKKWELDLAATEWVEERLLGGVEVEVEGERWVYDAGGGEWRRRRWVRDVQRTMVGRREEEEEEER